MFINGDLYYIAKFGNMPLSVSKLGVNLMLRDMNVTCEDKGKGFLNTTYKKGPRDRMEI